MLQDGSEEQAFTARILELDEDSKNYHAWAHRPWAIKTFALREPACLCRGKLSEDFRNNSAWSSLPQRSVGFTRWITLSSSTSGWYCQRHHQSLLRNDFVTSETLLNPEYRVRFSQTHSKWSVSLLAFPGREKKKGDLHHCLGPVPT